MSKHSDTDEEHKRPKYMKKGRSLYLPEAGNMLPLSKRNDNWQDRARVVSNMSGTRMLVVLEAQRNAHYLSTRDSPYFA